MAFHLVPITLKREAFRLPDNPLSDYPLPAVEEDEDEKENNVKARRTTKGNAGGAQRSSRLPRD